MLNLLAIGVITASLVIPVAADDPPAVPPPGTVVVDLVTVNGSGCAPGTVAVVPAPDRSAFAVTFDAYEARVGVGALPVDQRRSCQLRFVVHPPAGWTYAIASHDFQGHASLAAGAGAVYRTTSYIGGQSAPAWQPYPVVGPVDADVSFSGPVDPASLVWAPCGQLRSTNVLTEIRVNAGTSDVRSTTSSARLDRYDGLMLLWRRCDA